MPQITNYKEKIMRKKIFEPILGSFKIGFILSILFYSKQQKLLNQNLFQNIFKVKAVQIRPKILGKWGNFIFV